MIIAFIKAWTASFRNLYFYLIYKLNFLLRVPSKMWKDPSKMFFGKLLRKIKTNSRKRPSLNFSLRISFCFNNNTRYPIHDNKRGNCRYLGADRWHVRWQIETPNEVLAIVKKFLAFFFLKIAKISCSVSFFFGKLKGLNLF